MKKVILTVAIVASGFSTFALTNNPIQNEVISISIADEFKEITLESLPETVTAAISKYFPTATLNKAYINGSEQYKLEMTKDDSEHVIYTDKDGIFLQESDVLPKKEETTPEAEESTDPMQ